MNNLSKKISAVTLLLLLSIAFTACTRTPGGIDVVKAESKKVYADPAEAKIADAVAAIDELPNSTKPYTNLAALYVRRARATGDFSLNSKAESAVEKALTIDAEDVPARKLKASLHLTYHRFDEALEAGKLLQQQFPNDAFVYGVLTDANFELGNYDEAVKMAQRMIDIKPNSSSYARVGHLRSFYGDHKGAVKMMTLSARTADPQDPEAQSWCLTQLGDELWKYGKYPESEKVYDEALQILPNYYLAAVGKGRARASQDDFQSAIDILTTTNDRIPNVEALILLGDIYTRVGNTEKAKQSYDLVEIVEAKIGVNNDQKRLALMWANNNERLDDALAITIREHEMRKDVLTADALAWTLYRKERFAEAKVAINEAMKLKSDEAKFLYHAGMIENGLGNKVSARQSLENAIKLNPNFDLLHAQIAKHTLAELTPSNRR